MSCILIFFRDHLRQFCTELFAKNNFDLLTSSDKTHEQTDMGENTIHFVEVRILVMVDYWVLMWRGQISATAPLFTTHITLSHHLWWWRQSSRWWWWWSIRLQVSEWVSEWVSSCLTAHQHNTGYSVPLMVECQKWFILKATNMVQQIIIMTR